MAASAAASSWTGRRGTPGTNHGFHNDTTPRYDQVAATLAWERTIEFLNQTLK